MSFGFVVFCFVEVLVVGVDVVLLLFFGVWCCVIMLSSDEWFLLGVFSVVVMWLRKIVISIMLRLVLMFLGMLMVEIVLMIIFLRLFVFVILVMIVIDRVSMMIWLMLVMMVGIVSGSWMLCRICLGLVLKV